jgi:hypothetical protein
VFVFVFVSLRYRFVSFHIMYVVFYPAFTPAFPQDTDTDSDVRYKDNISDPGHGTPHAGSPFSF